MSTLTTIIQHSFGSQSHGNQRRKENNGIQIGKEDIKLPLLADDMIMYIENPKDLIKTNKQTNVLELISNYSKVVGYEVNTEKSITFLYTSNEQVECEIKNTIPFTLALPQNEIFRYKFNKICIRST